MNFVVALYAAILFFVLSPNVLLRLPRKGSTKVVAAVHAVVFGLVLLLTSKFVSQMFMGGMIPVKQEALECKLNSDCSKPGDICSPEGACVASA
uniref:Uncharacterized protein n=1 Tax=viral metagenome TaxID=1070528 RepID=A0A6C0D8H5_9ZZZZ